MPPAFRVLLLLIFMPVVNCFAQADSSAKVSLPVHKLRVWRPKIDSAAKREQILADSFAMSLLKTPDPNRLNAHTDSILKTYALNFNSLSFKPLKKVAIKSGTLRNARDQWVLLVVFGLLIYCVALVQLMPKDVHRVLSAFYNYRSLLKVSNEDRLLNSWAFIFLFILFGFTIGLFIYQVTQWAGVTYSIGGIGLFGALSLMVIALFLFKIITIRILGFVFDIGKLLKEYISILYLTYFNIAFVFLPVVICISLLSAVYIPVLIMISLGLVVLIFIIQYFRSTFSIISNFRFQKIYLFIYLCALEICPILILIKALNL